MFAKVRKFDVVRDAANNQKSVDQDEYHVGPIPRIPRQIGQHKTAIWDTNTDCLRESGLQIRQFKF